LLPPPVPGDTAGALDFACAAGGPDNMPCRTDIIVSGGLLTAVKGAAESGYLAVPWEVDGAGLLMGPTATPTDRTPPYPLQLELARGKVNQVRGQLAAWRDGGLQVSDALEQRVRDATLTFGRATTEGNADKDGTLAQDALRRGYVAAADLVN